jgi:nucleotide-binding universal stress UspA family protein
MRSGIAQPFESSILVVVNKARSARAVLGWSVYQADRRHSRVRVCYAPAFLSVDDHRFVDGAFGDPDVEELAVTLDDLGVGSRASLEVAAPDESTIEAIRARAVNGNHGLVIVGPLERAALVSLIFGSDRCGVDAGPYLPLTVVPPSAWSTVPPVGKASSLTVGFHGSAPAVAALAWAVGEADRRDGVVRAVMAWCEGDSGGLGGPVPIGAAPPYVVGQQARYRVADSLERCRVAPGRVSAVARRGMPAPTLVQEAAASDLLVISTGQSTVFGYRTLGAITLACIGRSPIPVVMVPCRVADDAPGHDRSSYRPQTEHPAPAIGPGNVF